MDARGRVIDGRLYEDFQPVSDWLTDAGADTVVLRLPGFTRQHLRVQLDNNRNIKISGERPLDGNRISRFFKEFQIPENCDRDLIRAKFENGTLTVILPKTILWESTMEPVTPLTKESPTVIQKTGETPDSYKDRADAHPKPTALTTAGAGSDKGSTISTAASEKQNNVGSKDGHASFTTETKKKEEEEEYHESQKSFNEPMGTVAGDELLKEDYMHGGGLVLGMQQSRQLVVNVAVGFLVALALLMYLSYKFAS